MLLQHLAAWLETLLDLHLLLLLLLPPPGVGHADVPG
jgi:hypothetical protein